MMFAGLAVVVSVPCPRSTMRFESLKFHTAITSAFTAAAEKKQNRRARDASESRVYISFPFCKKVALTAPRDDYRGELLKGTGGSDPMTTCVSESMVVFRLGHYRRRNLS